MMELLVLLLFSYIFFPRIWKGIGRFFLKILRKGAVGLWWLLKPLRWVLRLVVWVLHFIVYQLFFLLDFIKYRI